MICAMHVKENVKQAEVGKKNLCSCSGSSVEKHNQPLPPPVRHSGGLQGPPTSSSSQNKTPEASLSNPLHHLYVHPASETKK